MIAPAHVDVCDRCSFRSFAAAVNAAKAGTVIRVHDRQVGGVVVRVPLTIEGGGEILAGKSSIGIDVKAPHVTIHNLTLRGFGKNDSSGRSAAIVLENTGTTIKNVTFVDNTFALSTVNASHVVVNGANFESNDPAGDPIRIWRSRDITIAGSIVHGGRDVFINWSPNVVVRDSVLSHLRYGLHNMFSPEMSVLRNAFEDCEIGTNFMYAQHLKVIGNRFAHNAGPAGYGIGMEDTDDATIRDNAFSANHVGMHIINSPADSAETLTIEKNLFTSNGSGLAVQSDARSIVVVGNGFVDNTEQVQVSGGGSTPGITWSGSEGGNFWSDYAGFARDGSAVGAVPYRPNSTFESVLDANPDLQIFRRSAAAQAIDFATRTLAAQPEPKLTDPKPLMQVPFHQVAVGALKQHDDNRSNFEMVLASILSVPFVTIFASAVFPIMNHKKKKSSVCAPNGAAIELTNVTKLYSANRGVQDVSLTVHSGESVALWGPNGAGKTTLLRSILGQTSASGRITVCGYDRVAAKEQVRRLIGFAPQHFPDFEIPISRVVEMLTHLRKAELNSVESLFAEFALDWKDERYVSELSGGLRQRLGVACALIGDPPVLVLDEPTAGLDRASRRELLEILLRLRARGKTIVFTSHLLSDVQALADRVIVIEEGRISADVPGVAFERIAS